MRACAASILVFSCSVFLSACVEDKCQCDQGVCHPDTGECVQPWTLSCPAATGECSADKPYVCDSAGPPAYDCAACGCPGDKVCQEAFCYAPDILTLEHTDPLVPDDLPLDEYFATVEQAMSGPALSYEELVNEIDSLFRADARRAALLLGESHNSDQEQAIGRQLMRDLEGLGWDLDQLDIEGGDSPILDPEPVADLFTSVDTFTGDFTNQVHCQNAVAAVGDRLNDQGIYVQYSGSGHTSREICHHPEHWSICDLPHVSECVTSAGRKAVVVILFDPDPWLWLTDRVLLWRLEPYLDDPDTFSAKLDESIARFDQAMAGQKQASRYDAMVDGSEINVRVRRAEHAEDVFVAYIPRPERPAYLMESYRAVWNQPDLRQFLVDHGLAPPNCSISWDLSAKKIWLSCTKGDVELTATVDASAFELLDSNTSDTPAARALRPPPGLPSTDALEARRIGY